MWHGLKERQLMLQLLTSLTLMFLSLLHHTAQAVIADLFMAICHFRPFFLIVLPMRCFLQCVNIFFFFSFSPNTFDFDSDS